MNTLFFKIFVWFFATALLLVGLSLLTWTLTRPGRQDPLTAFGIEGPEERFAGGSVVAVDQFKGMRGPLTWLGEHGALIGVYLKDGRQIIDGPRLPAELRVLALESLRRRAPLAQAGPGRTLLLAMPVNESTVIGTLVPSRPKAGSLSTNLLRWSVPVVVSLLVCLALARYLSAPVEKFRAATQRLASGDLSVRVGPELGRRRDELTDAGRDFDVMAERIQDLVEGERRLLGDISHELRSPLSRLAVAVQLERKRGDTDERPMLDRIEREAQRLEELIAQLLTLARLRVDHDRAARLVDLGRLALDVASDAEFEAENLDCRIDVRAPEDCRVRGNPGLLRSALENVVRNAVRHTRPGTAVEIIVGDRARDVCVTVRDHGAGVPEKLLERLFEPFYRVDEARDRETGGVGLGLAIVKDVVRRHDGTVYARNAAGGGLEVELSLPAARL